MLRSHHFPCGGCCGIRGLPSVHACFLWWVSLPLSQALVGKSPPPTTEREVDRGALPPRAGSQRGQLGTWPPPIRRCHPRLELLSNHAEMKGPLRNCSLGQPEGPEFRAAHRGPIPSKGRTADREEGWGGWWADDLVSATLPEALVLRARSARWAWYCSTHSCSFGS